MPNQRKNANSPKDSKAKAGSTQPNVVKPQLSDLMKAAEISQPMCELVDTLVKYMEMNDPRETVGTLCDVLEREARNEARSEFPDIDSLYNVINPISGIVELLAGLHHFYPYVTR